MASIKFSELPENLRVQLSEEGRKELWHRVDEFGGVKTLSESFEFSQSKMYNWKNKELALPVKFVRRIMGENATSEVTHLKGRGSSGKIIGPEFPLQISDELLTRVDLSVVENEENIPYYITDEKALADHFSKSLQKLGAEHKIYDRDRRFELRFPKFVKQIFDEIDYQSDIAAKLDEVGKVEGNRIIFQDHSISIKEFEGEIISPKKRFELALQKEDSETIAEIISRESDKIKSVLTDA